MRLRLDPTLAALLAMACSHPGPSLAPAARSVAGERLSFVEGTAGSLRVSDGGQGDPAVVFLHGLGSDLEVWRPQLDHLRASRRVVAYDQRGHGASGKPRDGVYTLEALAADLEAVRRALGLERFVLVGHSLSGAVVTTYLGAHPEVVVGAVYVDAAGDFHGVARERLQEVVDREASPSFGASARRADFAEALGPRARPATRQTVLASLERMDPAAFAPLRRALFELRDARARFASHRGPALAIEAAENPYASTMAGAVLGLPRVEVRGVSHWLQLDDPDAVNRALDAFLARLASTP
ncbi:alpha/beta fold hydrolase [Anaeromyxobacter diazotrophicus]|uniref:AB hydrolase-1 domain-containing protein n=1 Tax=Anaeromyxobacter diazotrophicus TaxID=2590199 RepID=A0A7I9VN11_9BACT|nr:alpha/beta hydrolase [Anaeromyxobacter diazotrophicus]GEJ57793.1 hypothetical protein AMYX_25340 [Anaeromyxobacter diazotrophicus]